MWSAIKVQFSLLKLVPAFASDMSHQFQIVRSMRSVHCDLFGPSAEGVMGVGARRGTSLLCCLLELIYLQTVQLQVEQQCLQRSSTRISLFKHHHPTVRTKLTAYLKCMNIDVVRLYDMDIPVRVAGDELVKL